MRAFVVRLLNNTEESKIRDQPNQASSCMTVASMHDLKSARRDAGFLAGTNQWHGFFVEPGLMSSRSSQRPGDLVVTAYTPGEPAEEVNLLVAGEQMRKGRQQGLSSGHELLLDGRQRSAEHPALSLGALQQCSELPGLEVGQNRRAVAPPLGGS